MQKIPKYVKQHCDWPDLQEMYIIKNELWNDIAALMKNKYNVPDIIIIDQESVIDNIVSNLEEMIEESKEP